jgi:hypothetical protein
MRLSSPAPLTLALALLLALGAGCGGDDSIGPATLATLDAVAGNDQLGVAGRALVAPLVVEANDASGQPIANVTLQFTVSQGGGQVDAQERTTDSQGRASVTYTLGPNPGAAQQVTVSASGSDASATFTATATVAPAAMNAAAGSGQSAEAGVAVAESPAVRVVDAGGQPVGGVPVRFQVTRGGGSISAEVRVTGLDGVASAGPWTMGASGVNIVQASVDGETLDGEPATFVATTTPADGLDIVVRFFNGVPTVALQIAFAEAETRWESVITDDLSDALVNQAAGQVCGPSLPETPALNESVDDLLILAEVKSLDGPGNVLAQAGPCQVRDATGNGTLDVGDFPGVGIMIFDDADQELVEQNGVLGTTVLHEMGHVLGIGVLWDVLGLLADPSQPSNPGADPHFTDPGTIAAFNAVGGTQYNASEKVPVENDGGEGTADVHWRESVFDTELMTGFVNLGPEPLSIVTIASLQAEGYSVDPNAADSYTLPPAAVRAPGRRTGIHLGRDIARVPIRLVAPSGRVTRTIER